MCLRIFFKKLNITNLLQAFCTLLKRDLSLNFKSKGNSLVSVLACNVLMKAYSDEDNWPDDFVKVKICLPQNNTSLCIGTAVVFISHIVVEQCTMKTNGLNFRTVLQSYGLWDEYI